MQPTPWKGSSIEAILDWYESTGLGPVLDEAQFRGFLGPGPLEPHVLHAAGFVFHTPSNGRVLDLGSGGGVPGLVLAAARPQQEFVLLDGKERRAYWLLEALERLGRTESTHVICEQAEVSAHKPAWRGSFQAVLARSFGPPAVTAETAAGFLCEGASLVVSDPPDATDRWHGVTESELGYVSVQHHEVELVSDQGRSSVCSHYTVVVAGSVPDRVPRTGAAQRKRPRF